MGEGGEGAKGHEYQRLCRIGAYTLAPYDGHESRIKQGHLPVSLRKRLALRARTRLVGLDVEIDDGSRGAFSCWPGGGGGHNCCRPSELSAGDSP